MRAEERLTPQVVEAIREYIADADGNEVYMVGRVGADGRVEEVKVGARGTEEQVLVLVPHLSGGDVIIHNHPSGGTRPSGADMVVAARWGNEGVGFYILDNSVESIYVVAEPVEQAQRASLDLDELAGHLTPGGDPEPPLSPVRGKKKPDRHVAPCLQGLQWGRAVRGGGGHGGRQVPGVPPAGNCLGHQEQGARGGVNEHHQSPATAPGQGHPARQAHPRRRPQGGPREGAQELPVPSSAERVP